MGKKHSHSLGDEAYQKANTTLAQSLMNDQTRFSRVKLYKSLVLRYVQFGYDGSVICTFKKRQRIMKELHIDRRGNSVSFKAARERAKFRDLEQAGLISLDANQNVIVVVDGLKGLPSKPVIKPPKKHIPETTAQGDTRGGQRRGTPEGDSAGGRPYSTH
jgi:hypothetical protein